MNKKGSLESVLAFVLVGVFALLIIGGATSFQIANGSHDLTNSQALNKTYESISQSYDDLSSSTVGSYNNYINDTGAQSSSILGGTSLIFTTIPRFFKFLTTGIVGIYSSTLGLVYTYLRIPPFLQTTFTILIIGMVLFGIWKALKIGLPN